jgi:prepilin-type N-terminal cleavage/methylation domain-containing protein
MKPFYGIYSPPLKGLNDMMCIRKEIGRARDCKGFTLIEMMMVVCIIGILVSIALPHLSDFAHRAYNTLAKSDMSSIMRVAKAKLNLGEGGNFSLSGQVVQCDDNSRLLVLSKGVDGNVNGLIDDQDPANNFFFISLHHAKGTKTYIYTYDGSTNIDTYSEI